METNHRILVIDDNETIHADFRKIIGSARPGDDQVEAAAAETILVAEDEWVVQTLTVRALRDAGYQTLTAADGEQAVRMFERHADAIALVLMDVVMPKLNGRAAYQRMVAVRPGVRAVFCSGYDPTTGEAGLLAEEGRRLLQKPFDPETLLRTVRDVLDAVNQEEALPCLA